MTPEELYLKKKAAKKANRRGGDEEEAKLDITSLMDVVSIIVVYLLKSYGSDPINITPTGGQKIPFSSADAAIVDGIPVYIAPRGITVGEDVVAQMNEEGDIDESAKNGKHMITPLFDALAEEADKGKMIAEAKGTEWNGRIILIGDERLKFSTLVDVMFTAGKAEFSEYNFAVIEGN